MNTLFPKKSIFLPYSAVYDYAQNGAELKKNIREYWWKSMVQLHDNIVGIDSSVFMDPMIWKASGHLDAFNDPLIESPVDVVTFGDNDSGTLSSFGGTVDADYMFNTVN